MVCRLTVLLKVQASEDKVREGVTALAESRRKAAEEQQQGSQALQAQQAATHSAQQQLQAAQVRHLALVWRRPDLAALLFTPFFWLRLI